MQGLATFRRDRSGAGSRKNSERRLAIWSASHQFKINRMSGSSTEAPASSQRRTREYADLMSQNANQSKEDGMKWMADMKAKFEAL